MKRRRIIPIAALVLSWAVAVLGGGSVRAQSPAPATIPVPDSLGALGAGIRAERSGEHARAAAMLEPLAAQPTELGDYVRLYLARAQAGLGADARAAATLEELLRLYPRSLIESEAALELGNLRRRAGDCAQATALFGLARERAGSAPEGAPATLRMAECLEQVGRASEARRYLMDVRESWPLEPADREARARLSALDAAHPELVPRASIEVSLQEARRLVKESEVQAATALLEGVVRDNEGSPQLLEVRLELAALLKRAGRPDDREAMLRALVRESPRSSTGLNAALALAQHLWNRGRGAETLAALDELESRDPPASMRDELAYIRARVLEEGKDWNGAVSRFQRLVHDFPTSDRAADALWRWTWLSYRHDPPAKHLATFEQTRAMAHAPELARRIRFWQSRALAAARQEGRARQILEALASEDPSGYYGVLARMDLEGREPVAVPLSGPDSRTWAALAPIAALDALALGPPPAAEPAVARRLERARSLADAMLDDLARREARAAEEAGSLDDGTRLWLARFYSSLGMPDRALKAAQKARAGGIGSVDRQVLGSHALDSFLFPLPYPHHLRRLASNDHIDPLLVAALIRNESLFDSRAHSPADARGMMQIIPSTGRRLASELGLADFQLDDLFQPRVSLTLGCHYLGQLFQRYGGDLERSVAAYNAGEEAVDRWTARDPSLRGAAFAETIPYSETRNYVRNVVRDLMRYREIYAVGN